MTSGNSSLPGARGIGVRVLRVAGASAATGPRGSGRPVIVFIKVWTESEGKKDQEICRRSKRATPVAMVHDW